MEELNASHNRLVTLSGRDFRGFPVLCWADVSMNQIRTLMPELVANTRCTIHGVPDVLRIYLQGEFIPGSLSLSLSRETSLAAPQPSIFPIAFNIKHFRYRVYVIAPCARVCERLFTVTLYNGD